MNPNTIYCGDALEVMSSWEDNLVQCCVTSPPYWGLRDYGVDGQLGLEKTPEEYIEKMVAVFRQVRRVLKPDGTLWLNIGDSYCGGGRGGNPEESPYRKQATNTGSVTGMAKNPGRTPIGMKPKDLVGIPWMVAFALRADGWYLRQDIIWAKPNPMPESVRDRCTKSHEYLFLLTKSAKYFYNAEAIKEPASHATTKMPDGWDTGAGAHGSFHREGREKGKKTDKQRGHSRRHAGFNDRWDQMEKAEQCSGTRNKRSVWEIATKPFPEAHFATFPEKLVEPCILAGSREGDIVLDPFGGSGTTGAVAARLGRKYVLIELNQSYIDMALRTRLNQTTLL